MLGEYRGDGYYVEGLKYETPPQPKSKDIINYGIPHKMQKWKRFTDYEQFIWDDTWLDKENNTQYEEQLNCLRDEVHRINYGVWYYINGEPTYLNADMYFFCQWYVLPDTGEYPEYRDTSLYYYRFIEIVSNSKVATGHTLIKGRRLGATSMVISRFLRKMIISERKNFGITSKSAKDAGAEGAFGFLTMAFESLPNFLQPDIDGNSNAKSVLSLRRKLTRGEDTKNTGLNVKAFWRAPGMNTFDSGAYEEILIDESGKFDAKSTKVDITIYLPVVTKCVKKGALITGKLYLPTTVNSPESGGKNYQKVWNDSDHIKSIKETSIAKSISGLYRIMIPAYYGFAGYVDAYGNSVWDTPTEEQRQYLISIGTCPDPNIGAKQYLLNERKPLENRPEDLQAEIQMNPFNAEEVFETANDRCIFELPDLVKREKELLEKLEDEGKDIIKGELGRRGWFIKSSSGRMHFADDPKDGLWYVPHLLNEEESNKFKIVAGKKIPTNEELGAAGLDPIASGAPTVDKGSDMCCIIRNRFSSMNPDNTGVPMAMMIGRMSNVDKINEQVFNGLQYYGVKMLGEFSQLNWIEYAEREQLEGYLYKTQRSNKVFGYGMTTTGEASRDEHAQVQVMSSLHDHDKIPFIRLVRDRKEFNVKKRGDFDACMADGYALIALKEPLKKIVQKVEYNILRKGTITTY
jgi:hypothetical protein